MSLSDPLINRIFLVADLPLLLIGLDVCHPDDLMRHPFRPFLFLQNLLYFNLIVLFLDIVFDLLIYFYFRYFEVIVQPEFVAEVADFIFAEDRMLYQLSPSQPFCLVDCQHLLQE